MLLRVGIVGIFILSSEKLIILFMYSCMYVSRMYACMYVYIYVCMYICMFIHLPTYLFIYGIGRGQV